MTKITQAFIFCAGRGERMRPLTEFTPKPLLEVKNKKILDYILEKLQEISSLEKICANEGMEPVIFNLSEYMKSGAMLSCMVMHLNRVDHCKTLL